MRVIFLCVTVLAAATICHAYDWSTNPGDGTEANPYQISDPNQLIAINEIDTENLYFILTNDIVFDPNNNPNHVFDDPVIHEFKGDFNGADKTIDHLAIDVNPYNYNDYPVGLIGYNTSGAIRNVHIRNAVISCNSPLTGVGILCGNNTGDIQHCTSQGEILANPSSSVQYAGGFCGINSGTINNCSSSGNVSGDYNTGGVCGGNATTGTLVNCAYLGGTVSGDHTTGGLVARNYGSIVHSYAIGTIQGRAYVGGLTGIAWGLVEQCFANCIVSGDSHVGGLVGSASDSDIFNCTTSGSVSGTSHIGGLLGSSTGTVRNCHSEADVNGNDRLGGLIGYSYYGAISNCTTTGTVTGTGNEIGGIVGSSWGTIKNCHSSSPVNGANSVGGLAGSAGGIGDFMIRCSASGSVTGINIDSRVVGGLMGELVSGTVRRSFAEGSVTCIGTSSSSVGGFVGSGGKGNYPPVFYNCYARGNVTGHTEVGGFAGRIDTTTLQPCTIITCYSTGLVEGDSDTGGFLGLNTRADTVFEGLFWDMDTSQTSNGIASQNPDPDGIIGLETLAMKQKSSFLGWDFVGEDTNGKNEIWRMCTDGVDTPRLSWEFAQGGDFACGDSVDILDLQALAQNCLTVADSTPATFNHACDANGDGTINLHDFSVLGENW